MSKQASPALIGGFVLGALALATAGVLIFGSRALFQGSETFVVLFSGSVTGLEEGAPVMFRGVPVGSVTDIDAVLYTDTTDIEIPVFVELYPESVRSVGEDLDLRPAVEELVDRGLRAQLATQSLVTGLLYVALDFFPDTPVVYRARDIDVPEIPSTPSTLEQAANTLNELVAEVRRLPLQEIVRKIDSTLAGVSALVNSPELEQAVAGLDEAVRAVQTLADTANQEIAELAGQLETTSDQAQRTLEQIDATVASLSVDLGPGSPIHYQALSTLEELSETARSVRSLTETLSRQPDALLFGRGGREE